MVLCYKFHASVTTLKNRNFSQYPAARLLHACTLAFRSSSMLEVSTRGVTRASMTQSQVCYPGPDALE